MFKFLSKIFFGKNKNAPYPKGNKHLSRIVELGNKNGWYLERYHQNTGLLIFKKKGYDPENKNVQVYTTKMTVGTAIKHPQKGDTQLFRKDVSYQQLKTIFKNPRTHTGKGYYNKSFNPKKRCQKRNFTSSR